MNSNPLTPLAGFLCPFLFIGFFVLAIVIVVRLVKAGASGPRGPGQSPPPQINVPTQLTEDGFWIISCPANPDSMIHYHYWSAGTRYSGQVPFKPEPDGRQFVYTGRRPDQVAILRIVDVDEEDGLSGSTLIPPIVAGGPVWDLSDSSSAPSSPPSSSSSFPSAY